MSTVGGGQILQPRIVPFFALRPDGEALQQLARLRDSAAARLGLRSLVPDERLHLSLCEAGRAARLREPYDVALRKSGDGTHAMPLELVFDRLKRFGGQGGSHAVVLTANDASADALKGLCRSLAVAQLFNGLVAGAKSLSPHVTLGYGDQLPALDEPVAPITWRVREFVLIASHQGLSRHEEWGRWSLE